MNTFVAFFRGINVGGRNILPMKELVSILETLDCMHIKTYIQSGNAVFQTQNNKTLIAKELSHEINESHGFEPHVLILEKAELETTIQQNPFSTEEGKTLHFFFLSEKPQSPDLDSIDTLKTSTESYELRDNTFYLLAPDGIARSKLAANVEKKLGVPTTARNWNTVSKVIAMLNDVSPQEQS